MFTLREKQGSNFSVQSLGAQLDVVDLVSRTTIRVSLSPSSAGSTYVGGPSANLILSITGPHTAPPVPDDCWVPVFTWFRLYRYRARLAG